VYAFEPQESIYQILLQNIALNGLGDTVTAYKMALGDQSCNTKMARNPKASHDPKTFSNRGSNPIVGCLDDTGDPLAFEMRTLDSFELDNVGFIKIDVEGAHLLVLKGAEETIKRNKPLMLVEILGGTGGSGFTHHEATQREEVIQWLEERGYAVLQWQGSDHIAIPVP
jgi:FkbM family methyltransferase